MRFAILAFVSFLLLISIGCGSKVVVIQPAPEQNPTVDNQTIGMRKAETNFNASIEHLRQAKMFYARDKFKQAIQHAEKAIFFDSRNWEAYYYLGLCMQRRQQYAHALENLQNSLQYVPDNRLVKAELHVALGYCFENMGRLDEARKEYKMALNYNPGNDSARKGNNRVKVEKTLKDWGKDKDIDYEG